MRIKITNNKGFYKKFNGNIEYHDTYVIIRYINKPGQLYSMNETIIPWRVIDEINVKE